ncbi:MAG: hypothetical protein ACE5JV_02255 [Nitrososphaerales archaeon]
MSGELPKWAEEEINSIKESSFKLGEAWEGTGYFLDIDEKKRTADIQFYEKLPVGKHIVTVEIPGGVKIEDFMKGLVYAYKVKVLKAPLSEKLVKFLQDNLSMSMDAIYRFQLESLQLLDVESDLAPSAAAAAGGVDEDSED